MADGFLSSLQIIIIISVTEGFSCPISLEIVSQEGRKMSTSTYQEAWVTIYKELRPEHLVGHNRQINMFSRDSREIRKFPVVVSSSRPT